MGNDKNLSLNDIIQKYHIEEVDVLTKILEDIEQKAFLEGYDHAIRILNTSRILKKDHS